MKWKKGDDSYNLRQLIETSVKNMERNFPGLANLEYNIEHGEFIETKSGKPVGDDQVEQLTSDTGGGIEAAKVGSATAKRAAFFSSLLREVHRRELVQDVFKPGQLERLTKSLRQTLYSQSTINEPRSKAGVSVSAVEKILAPEKLAINDKVGLRLKVVADHSGLPEPIQRQIKPGKVVRGVMSEGVVYIVAGNHKTTKEALITFAHEVVGHVGMEQVIGPEWANVADKIKWLHKTGNKRFKKIMDEVHSRYGNQLDEITETQEFIAVAVEHQIKDGVIGALLKKIRAAIRRFLKSIGITRPFAASDLDIIIQQSRDYLRTGKSESSNSNYVIPNEDLFSQQHVLSSQTSITKIEYDINVIENSIGVKKASFNMYAKPKKRKEHNKQLEIEIKELEQRKKELEKAKAQAVREFDSIPDSVKKSMVKAYNAYYEDEFKQKINDKQHEIDSYRIRKDSETEPYNINNLNLVISEKEAELKKFIESHKQNITDINEILSPQLSDRSLAAAMKVLAKHEGWTVNEVKGGEGRYFTLSKKLPESEIIYDEGNVLEDTIRIGVRTSDHSRTSAWGHPEFGKSDVHINLAPKTGGFEKGGKDNEYFYADNWESMLWKLRNVTVKNSKYDHPQLVYKDDPTETPLALFSQENKAQATATKSRGKIKTWLKRNLTKEGLLNKATFEIKLKSDAMKNVGEEEIAYFVHDFEKQLKRFYGKKYNDFSEQDTDLLYGYLTGEKLVKVPVNVQESLDNMRSYLDSLSGEMIKALDDLVQIAVDELSLNQKEAYSEYLDTNGASGKLPERIGNLLVLQQTISGNIGTYLNRSYQAFDDPNWKEKALKDTKVVEEAKAFIRDNNPTLTDSEVTGAVRAILQSAKDSGNFMSLIAKGTKVGSKDVSIIKKRKDVPAPIRKLLGEYRDPKLNFARSASKMQWFLANHYFLKNLRETGLNTFLFKRPTGEYDTQVAGASSETMNPLNGLYTTEEFIQGMEDILDKFDGSDLMRQLIRFNSFIKYGKTILSPTTQARNFMSAYFFRIMNGHFSLKYDIKAFKATKADLFTHEKKWQEYINDLIGLGVLHDNPYASELKAALEDAIEVNVYKKGMTQPARKFLSWMQRVYQVGDDFHKIVGFENELRSQLKRGLSRDAARKAAAYRIRNGYPTYSMVPRAIKKLRRWPLIGTFVSFPYEIIRTAYNQFGFLKEDLQANKVAAAKRILGMSIASSAAYAASKLSMILMGMDDEDDEAVRAQLPEWSRNSNLYYIGYDEDGLPIYMDLSYLDPYTYLKKPITALMNGNNSGIDKKVMDALDEMAEPFIGTDIAAGALLEIWSNKKESGGKIYNEEDSGYRIAQDILNHARKATQPGVISNLERTVLAIQGESTPSGRQYKVKDEALAWIGFRVGTLNLNQSMIYKAYGFSDAKRSATRLLSQVAGSQQKTSEKDMKNAFSRMINARKRAYLKMIKLVNGARSLGVSDADIRRSLRSARISKKDIRYILRGEVPDWKMSSRFIKSASDRAVVSAPSPERKNEIKKEMIKRRRYIRDLERNQ